MVVYGILFGGMHPTTLPSVLVEDAEIRISLYASAIWNKDHLASKRGNPLQPHRLHVLISNKGSFFMHHPTDRISHTSAFVTPVVEHWLKREIAPWVYHDGSIRRPVAPWANAPL